MNNTVFVALADPTRRQLLECLAMGPTTATGLAVKFPVTRQALVKHLGALENAGMVAKERHGREVQYHLESAPLGEASAWLTTLSARWEQRLLRLKRYVEEES
jgi:DNA-binding transcriptional ArsR family regulator